jgi:porin
VNLFVTPLEGCTLAIGCYDGAGQEGISTGGRGAGTFLGDPADLFWIGELDLRFSLADGALPGRVALGATLHTGTFDRFDGTSQHGAKSFYATFDQLLWREHADDAEDLQGIGFGAIVGRADDEVSEAARQFSGGLTWTGFLPGRDQDLLGLGASWLGFSDEAGFGEDHELALELLWKVQVTPWLVVRPDLQYVLDPGGDPALDDAWVGLLRIEVTF